MTETRRNCRDPLPLPSVERLRELFDLDIATGTLFHRARPGNSNFNRQHAGNIAGRISSSEYWQVAVDGRNYLRARIVSKLFFGVEPPAVVDHINGDKLDDGIFNLRGASASQNNYNMRISSANKSGVKGVSWSKAKQRWTAAIRVEGRQISCGCFDVIADAERAVRAAREVYHGEFARHE